MLATFLTLLTFRLILPRNPATDATRLRRTIRDDTLAVVAGKRVVAAGWQQRQQHRIAQLGALLAGQPAAMTQASIEALAALHVGKELLRIRRGAERDGSRAPRARAAGLCAARGRPDSCGSACAARRARARRLAAAQPGNTELKWLMAASADVHVLLHTYAAYFTAVPERTRDAQ